MERGQADRASCPRAPREIRPSAASETYRAAAGLSTAATTKTAGKFPRAPLCGGCRRVKTGAVKTVESVLLSNILRLAHAYADARGLSFARVSDLACDDSRTFARLEAGEASVTLRKYQQAMTWFARRWPAGVPWPKMETVPLRRPKRTGDEERADHIPHPDRRRDDGVRPRTVGAGKAAAARSDRGRGARRVRVRKK